MNSKRIIWRAVGLLSILLLVGVTMAASGVVRSDQRADCPGTVTCPINGEEVCKDQCPLIDASRADCPGKVECPLTGELVCRDQCPLGAGDDEERSEDEVSPCCRDKQ